MRLPWPRHLRAVEVMTLAAAKRPMLQVANSSIIWNARGDLFDCSSHVCFDQTQHDLHERNLEFICRIRRTAKAGTWIAVTKWFDRRPAFPMPGPVDRCAYCERVSRFSYLGRLAAAPNGSILRRRPFLETEGG